MKQLSSFVLKSGNFFFRHRNLIFTLAFATLLVSDVSFLPNKILDLSLILLGVTLVLLGQGFRLLVIGYAYIKRGGKDGKVFAEKLVVEGFFAHSRNPMYVGNLLVVTGLCILYGSVWAYAVVFPFFCYAYYSIIVAEETYLKRQFGREYDDYERKVNRFIPNFRGIEESLKDFRYDWKRAIRKDYGNVFSNFAPAALILFRRLDHYFPSIWKMGVVAFGVLGIFYLLARFMKKSGYLASPN